MDGDIDRFIFAASNTITSDGDVVGDVGVVIVWMVILTDFFCS